MQTRLITSEEELVRLKSPWDRLVRGNPETDRPFFSWDWFHRGWLHFGRPNGQTLFVIAVEEGPELIGLLPLVAAGRRSSGIPFRTLEFCGTGMMPRNTAYFDPSRRDDVFQALSERLFSERSRWDMLELSNVPECSPFHDFWLAASAEERTATRHAVIRRRGFLAPYIELSGTLDDYLESVSKGTRKNVRKHLKRFNESEPRGTIRFFTRPEEMEEGLRRMLDVRAESWKGAFRDEHYPLFYREITPILSERREVEIAVLYLGETPVASGYMLVKNGVYYGNTRDYDKRFRDWAPGILLLYFQLEHLLSEQGTTFDFCGTTYDHKEKFATGSRRHSTFQIFHAGLKSRFLYYVKTFWLPLLRKIMRKPEPDDLISKKNRY